MKICFTGSHGTGKSTLCNELTKHLPKAFYIQEIARQEITRIGRLPYNMTDTERFEFQKRLLQLQLQAEAEHDNFMSDRGLMDILAYSYDLPQYQQLLEIALKSNIATRYSMVFYIPIEIEPVDDGIRSDDPVYQLDIDRKIVQICSDLGINTYVITGSVEERTKQVLDTLKLFKLD